MDSTISTILSALQQPAILVHISSWIQQRTVKKLSDVLFKVARDLKTNNKEVVIHYVTNYIIYGWGKDEIGNSSINREEEITYISSQILPPNEAIKRKGLRKQKIEQVPSRHQVEDEPNRSKNSYKLPNERNKGQKVTTIRELFERLEFLFEKRKESFEEKIEAKSKEQMKQSKEQMKQINERFIEIERRLIPLERKYPEVQIHIAPKPKDSKLSKETSKSFLKK